MAWTTPKTWAAGNTLTAADMNTYVRDNSVELKTLVDGKIPLPGSPSDGEVLTYDSGTSAWVAESAPSGGFTHIATITATNASWPIPSLGSPIVRVTVVAGGGGGGAPGSGGATVYGSTGGTTTWNDGTNTLSATGGLGGISPGNGTLVTGRSSRDYDTAGNGGGAAITKEGGADYSVASGTDGLGGQVKHSYYNLAGKSTASITVGAGGSGASSGGTGGAGGDGVVYVEYKAA